MHEYLMAHQPIPSAAISVAIGVAVVVVGNGTTWALPRVWRGLLGGYKLATRRWRGSGIQWTVKHHPEHGYVPRVHLSHAQASRYLGRRDATVLTIRGDLHGGYVEDHGYAKRQAIKLARHVGCYRRLPRWFDPEDARPTSYKGIIAEQPGRECGVL